MTATIAAAIFNGFAIGIACWLVFALILALAFA